jgi:hypothetical protein
VNLGRVCRGQAAPRSAEQPRRTLGSRDPLNAVIPSRKAPPRWCLHHIPRSLSIIPAHPCPPRLARSPPHQPRPERATPHLIPIFPPHHPLSHQPPTPIRLRTMPPRHHPHAAPPSCECRPSAFTCLPTHPRASLLDHPAPIPLSPVPSPSPFSGLPHTPKSPSLGHLRLIPIHFPTLLHR